MSDLDFESRFARPVSLIVSKFAPMCEPLSMTREDVKQQVILIALESERDGKLNKDASVGLFYRIVCRRFIDWLRITTGHREVNPKMTTRLRYYEPLAFAKADNSDYSSALFVGAIDDHADNVSLKVDIDRAFSIEKPKIEDMVRRRADGQRLVDVAKHYGIHHVTVSESVIRAHARLAERLAELANPS